jgi:hypothetical protein
MGKGSINGKKHLSTHAPCIAKTYFTHRHIPVSVTAFVCSIDRCSVQIYSAFSQKEPSMVKVGDLLQTFDKGLRFLSHISKTIPALAKFMKYCGKQ